MTNSRGKVEQKSGDQPHTAPRQVLRVNGTSRKSALSEMAKGGTPCSRGRGYPTRILRDKKESVKSIRG